MSSPRLDKKKSKSDVFLIIFTYIYIYNISYLSGTRLIEITNGIITLRVLSKWIENFRLLKLSSLWMFVKV